MLATGWHKPPGGDHAEVAALRKLGCARRRATAYVTLEPYDFTGRTPPCTRAADRGRVARVVVGMRDPNPRVAGGGARAAARRPGSPSSVGVLGESAAPSTGRTARGWRTKRPWVTLKAAVTLDGRLAARGGDAKWVSGELSRLEAHRMRDASDAILVGADTVRARRSGADDAPAAGRGHDPKRVILDGG